MRASRAAVGGCVACVWLVCGCGLCARCAPCAVCTGASSGGGGRSPPGICCTLSVAHGVIFVCAQPLHALSNTQGGAVCTRACTPCETTPRSALSPAVSNSSRVISMSGRVRMLSHASSAFSTSSRILPRVVGQVSDPAAFGAGRGESGPARGSYRARGAGRSVAGPPLCELCAMLVSVCVVGGACERCRCGWGLSVGFERARHTRGVKGLADIVEARDVLVLGKELGRRLEPQHLAAAGCHLGRFRSGMHLEVSGRRVAGGRPKGRLLRTRKYLV